MNLPDMLRQPDGVVFVKDVNMSGVTGPEIGHELAALVEAHDELVKRALDVIGWIEGHAHVEESDLEWALAGAKLARAALVAKIGGKG